MVKIELHRRFERGLAGLKPSELAGVESALLKLRSGFGSPHEHAGLGIRRLRRNLFECRADLRLRVLFYASKGTLTIFAVADHNEVAALLRSL